MNIKDLSQKIIVFLTPDSYYLNIFSGNNFGIIALLFLTSFLILQGRMVFWG